MFLPPPQIAFKTKTQMFVHYHIYIWISYMHIYMVYSIINAFCILLSFQIILQLLYPKNTELFTFQLILATACKLQEFYKPLF